MHNGARPCSRKVLRTREREKVLCSTSSPAACVLRPQYVRTWGPARREFGAWQAVKRYAAFRASAYTRAFLQIKPTAGTSPLQSKGCHGEKRHAAAAKCAKASKEEDSHFSAEHPGVSCSRSAAASMRSYGRSRHQSCERKAPNHH